MDMTFMAKFLVQGRDAGEFLNYVSANEVDGEAGKITYTQWLNHTGKLEADLTVIKFDDEKYMVVSSDTAHRHTETWLKRNIGDDQHVFVTRCYLCLRTVEYPGPQVERVAPVADHGRSFQ